jgi:3-oxoacyl-[acyl-carrier-protein] synthase-3
MANTVCSGVRIAGVASAVPSQIRTVEDEAHHFGAELAAKISQNVGVRTRHTAPPELCTSDLCLAAAERLLTDLNWQREEIVALIFLTQSPDYFVPATSHILHLHLGLPVSCAAFDVNLGCSGYVYGLWMASLVAQSLRGKVLFLAGDTSSRSISPMDQSVAFLFGDAGTATALEPSADALPMNFELGADGSGFQKLIVPAGGFRHPRNASTCLRTPRDNGLVRSDEDLFMDGAEIFAFTLKRVPPLVKTLLAKTNLGIDDIDAFVFHQANLFMLDYLARRLKIPAEKLILGLEEYGNTSSASIPMAITTTPLRNRLTQQPLRLLLAGFGVGFSWAGCILTLGPGVFPEVVEYKTGELPAEAAS